MKLILATSLAIVGIIHLLPITGVAGAERLTALYGIALADPDLVLLLRHRAVLFGILGSYVLIAAFVPALQLSALVMALVSVVSFLALALSGDAVSPGIGRIVTADWIALGALVVGFVAYARTRSRA